MTLENRGYRYKITRKEETKEVRLASRNKNNRNREQNPLRRHDQKSTVSDLVYKYLRKIAYTDSVRKQRNNACNRFRRRNARKRNIHSRRNSNTDNRLRSYVSEALSFAVHSGYLIPIDRTGRFLQLSPCLTLFSTKNKNNTYKLIKRKRFDCSSSETNRWKRYS
ncbi:uncharacterized protein LOC117230801 [Bombus vosnesenskii]|uniref:Uncharacterized protein LOC117230801 n=2 Tax=Pyrobombus TaxID=144703 RepID=A0A6J3JW00_9HYME|nr:uncharacterized protein LOC117230801 [Bombus vosnesenskii]